MNTTPWFAGHVKPARIGWYEVNGDFLKNETGERMSHHQCTFRYWDGKNWLWSHPEFKELHLAGFGSCDRWRGLIKEMK